MVECRIVRIGIYSRLLGDVIAKDCEFGIFPGMRIPSKCVRFNVIHELSKLGTHVSLCGLEISQV